MCKKITILILCICILSSLTVGCERGKKVSTASPSPQQSVQTTTQTNTQSTSTVIPTQDENVEATEAKESYGAKLDYKPIEFKKGVAPYSVKSDLSNVENISQFG